ncbi:MAG: aquaporin [Actinomycetia bacterium]|nr:aquaporin [Actinomycetes bacterium]
MSLARKMIAEFVGTLVLVFMGCGSAVLLGCDVPGGHLAVALCFGLAIVAMAYAIGNVSGCHVNPAVSLALLLDKRISIVDFVGYVVAQVVGAIAGAGLLKMVVGFGVKDLTGGLGSNGVASVGGAGGAFVVEIILTFIFVLTILAVTSDEKKSSVAGLVIGLTLAFVHIVGIPLTGTSVNPARSIGPALLSGNAAALSDLWVFIVAPLVGAAVAFAVFMVFKPLIVKKEATE